MPIGSLVPLAALALVLLIYPCAAAAAAGSEDLASVRRLLRSSPTSEEIDALVGAVAGAPGASGVAARDTNAYKLLSLGYSAKETADVVSGRITRSALDVARRMLATGQRREVVEGYLERQYRRRLTQQTASSESPLVVPPPHRRPGGPREQPGRQFDAAIVFYAARHNVNAALVRAMIAAESGFEMRAQSPRGAIGLMQLMPATARELGVNPWVAHENIEGGVRYVAEMLRTFGSIELALIAYNAGPGYAHRYARREVALYGETRNYVRHVLALARFSGLGQVQSLQ
ncbi:MAG: lytic transglycosylase domain-containing protein [Vicinamibacterales bacterium]